MRNSAIAGVVLGLGIVVVVALVGARQAPHTPQPHVSPSASPHGLVEGEQRPGLPDCVEEDGDPTSACVWDRWIRGENPNPGVTPRYVIVTPEPEDGR